MAPLYLALWALVTSLCQALPSTESAPLTLEARQLPIVDDPRVEVVYQFLPGIAPENAALRSNGQLLVTCLTCNFVSQVDPSLGPTQTRRTVYRFPLNVINVLGIAELQKDVFAVVTAQLPLNLNNLTSALPTPKGPPSLWTLDLRGYQAPAYDSSKIVATEVISNDMGILWDGLAVINAEKGLLATTDFAEGNIYLLDIPNKSATILASGFDAPLLTDTLLANGLKHRQGKLYFTASATGTYGYVPVNSDGMKTGDVQVLYEYGVASVDDFDIAPSGNVYFSTFTKLDGGIIKRSAGAAVGQEGGGEIVRYPLTNSIVARTIGKGKSAKCRLLFTAFLRFQVGRVVLDGEC